MSQIRLSREREALGQRINRDFTPKRSNQSWTDQRIEEIKKKYDSSVKKHLGGEVRNRIKTQYCDKENTKKHFKTDYDSYQYETHQKSTSNKGIYSALRASQTQNSNFKEQDGLSFYTTKGSAIKQKPYNHVSAFDACDNDRLKLPLEREKPSKHASIRLMTEYSTFTRHREPVFKLNRREVYDSRMENIDKINSKIKKILDCIHNCQLDPNSREMEVSRMDKNNEISQSYLRRSIISNDMRKSYIGNQFEETKILEKQKFYYQQDQMLEKAPYQPQNQMQREIICPGTDSQAEKSREQYLNLYKSKLNGQDQEIYLRKSVLKDREILRSSSSFSRTRKQNNSRQDKSIMDESKIQHINNQIDRFHHKIEELEQRKRTMNISFKPYDFDFSPAKKIQRDYTPDSFKKMKNIYQNRAEQTKSYFFKDLPRDFVKESFEKSPELSEKKDPSLLRRTSEQSLSPKKLPISLFHEEDNKVQKKSILHDIQESLVSQQSSQKTPKPYDNEQLRKKIGQRMNQRRQMLEDMHNQKFLQTLRPETQKLIQTLCQQVSLDEQLRNAKNWFAESHTLSKIHSLRQELIKNGINMSFQEIEKEFNSTNDEENDPFFSFREEKFTIVLVVEKYLQAEQFWRTSLMNQWDFDQLIEAEHFMKKLLNKKEIMIEDLVRLLNTETGNFYRNRDVYLIFDRVRKQINKHSSQRVTIEQLRKVLGK